MISRGIIEGILLLTAINMLAVIVVDTVPQGYHRPASAKTGVGRIGGGAGPPGRRYEQDGRDGGDFSADSSEIYGPRGKGDGRGDSYGGVGQGGGSAGRGGGYGGAGRDGKGYGDTARGGGKGFGHAGQGEVPYGRPDFD
uniref:Uncharacterized protein n=1 Tax=Onchocerca volvulus TaxID=6282 RepID=A0A8R1TIR6_ONCVO